jgi:SAM-dependent methyltransferase
MTVRTAAAEPEFDHLVPRKPAVGPESMLAHNYCVGEGIELGAAAHNPFNLPSSVNVSPFSDDPDNPEFEDWITYKKHQIENCGRYAIVDLPGEACSIPVPDASQDYILSSHVVEHVPDLVGAFFEWNRVLRKGGVIFTIFPKHDAAELDARREITSLWHFIEDFVFGRDPETHPFDGVEPRRRGHYHVFSLESMVGLIEWCNRHLGLNWQIQEVEETDSKVGNGHSVVARYLGPLQDREVQLHLARAELARMQAPGSSAPFEPDQARQGAPAEAELAAIKKTRSWKVLQRWWRLGLWLMPSGSLRRRIYSGLTSRLSRLLEGPTG